VSTLLRHTRYCADTSHDEGSCCESATIPVGDIGEVHVLAGEDKPVIYVDDEERGLFADRGRYDVDEAELVALAMLEAVRIARTDASSAYQRTNADAGAC